MPSEFLAFMRLNPSDSHLLVGCVDVSRNANTEFDALLIPMFLACPG